MQISYEIFVKERKNWLQRKTRGVYSLRRKGKDENGPKTIERHGAPGGELQLNFIRGRRNTGAAA